jgi:hypothetical protein
MGDFVGRAGDMADDLNEMLDDQQPEVEPEPEEQAPPEPEPEPEAPTTINIGGIEYPAAMAQDINGLVQWAQSLTPEQYERVNQALMAEQAAAQEQPAPEPEPEVEYDDPDLKRLAEEQARLKAELEAERERLQQMEQSSAAQTMEQRRAEFQKVEAEVREDLMSSWDLNDQEYESLVATAAGLNILQPQVQQLGLEEGLRKTMETALFANPDLRQRYIEMEAQSRAHNTISDERKEAAAALSPQGGTNIPDQTPANLPISEKRAAMVEDINQMLGGT